MSTAFLVKSIVILAIILLILVFGLVLSKKSVKNNRIYKDKKIVNANNDFEYLKKIILNKESTTVALKEALEQIIQNYSIIDISQLEAYINIILKLCKHQNTNKVITIKFITDLEKANLNYKEEINAAMLQGLNSRN